MPHSSQPLGLVGARIFDGEKILTDHAAVLAGDRIADLVPLSDFAADIPVKRYDGGLIAPGFIDAQINGAGGVLFNEAPTVETLKVMMRAQGRFGTTAMLPTFITDRPTSARMPSQPCAMRSMKACRALSASTSRGRSCRQSARAHMRSISSQR